MKRLLLTACVLLLAAADSHAFGRRPLFRRTCVSPAPARTTRQAEPERIPPLREPVPAIPPGVQMPATGLLTLPARVVQGCVNGVCPTR